MTANSDIFIAYRGLVKGTLGRIGGGWWLDAGGGRVCEFFGLLEGSQLQRGIVVDGSRADLAANQQLKHFVEADLDSQLPFHDNSIAAVFSSRTLEHLRFPQRFLEESFRILHPGGELVLVLPTGRAPFSLIKRLLPNKRSKRLVTQACKGANYTLCWAPLYHNGCSPHALVNSVRSAGFEVNQVEISFRQAHHFKSLSIAYWPMRAYDALLTRFRLNSLAAYVALRATKS